MNVQAKFSMPKFGTKQIAKKPAAPATVKKAAVGTVKKAVGTVKKSVAPPSGGARQGGVGYKKFEGDALWLPNTTRPDWLDGSLPGEITGFFYN